MIDVKCLRPTAEEMLSGLVAGETMKDAMLFRANALKNLPKAANEMLDGMRQTPALRHRILVAAQRVHAANVSAQTKLTHRKRAAARLTPAVGMAFTICLMIGIGIFYGQRQLSPPLDHGMNTYQAGSPMDAGAPRASSLFAGEEANPPIIGINGRYYRMLTSPLSVSPSLVGGLIAEVQEYTEEPSLASVVGVVSNVAEVGSRIYEVDGISHKTACVAEVAGTMRLFQRVSYASNSTMGNEMLEDTLSIRGRVQTLELSGVGIIQDEASADELINTLLEFSNYSGSDTLSSSQALTIYLKNGLSLQLNVQDDLLGACGTWACPEFFEAFAAELAN